MKMAIDAQLVLRNHARRMLIGAAEVGRWSVVIPATAAAMATLSHTKVARGYALKKVKWELRLAGRDVTKEELGLLVEDRIERLSVAFTRWMDDEPKRNDRVFEIGQRTRRARGVATELVEAGVVDDRDDTRWSIGEDPYVLAEALEAGAHWIASGNFNTLKPQRMERWLDQAHAEGRFTHVPRPFILDPETAVETMLRPQGPRAGHAYDSELLTIALAQALSEPKKDRENLARRVAILGRFANDLSESGMRSAGNALADWCEKAATRSRRGQESETWQEIRKMQGIIHVDEVDRTRAAEDRRIEMERAEARPTEAAPARGRSSGGVTG